MTASQHACCVPKPWQNNRGDPANGHRGAAHHERLLLVVVIVGLLLLVRCCIPAVQLAVGGVALVVLPSCRRVLLLWRGRGVDCGRRIATCGPGLLLLLSVVGMVLLLRVLGMLLWVLHRRLGQGPLPRRRRTHARALCVVKRSPCAASCVRGCTLAAPEV